MKIFHSQTHFMMILADVNMILMLFLTGASCTMLAPSVTNPDRDQQRLERSYFISIKENINFYAVV